MHRYPFIFTLLLGALTPGLARQAQDGCCHSCCGEEPFLPFLDDLRCFPHGMCKRNPYEERMETERHDYTQSTTTVGRGVLQIESGYLYLYKDQRGEIEQSHATPETLLRLGLSDDIEFRVRWNYLWKFAEDEPSEDSALDMIWSFKLQMTEQRGWLPQSALEIRSIRNFAKSKPQIAGSFAWEWSFGASRPRSGCEW